LKFYFLLVLDFPIEDENDYDFALKQKKARSI